MATSYINNTDEMEHKVPEISWNALRHAGRDVSCPFQLTLANTKSALYCDELVRIIPGKRLVFFGVWEGLPIVAKIFIERSKAKKNLEADVEGIEALVNCSVPTPKLMYKGHATDKRIQVLLFEKITDANNLEYIWQNKKNLDDVVALLRKVTIELATQHVLGIVQRDLHLKNFLINQKQIYTLDGGSIDQYEEILPKKESLNHLGLFFSQLGAGTEKLQLELFETYTRSRGWIVNPSDWEILQAAVKAWNIKRWHRFKEKIFRSCSAFAKIRTSRSRIMFNRTYSTPEFINFLHNPDVAFQAKARMLKEGRSATVVKVKARDKVFVVKRYNVKSVWHWLRRCFRESRAVNSWRLSQRLTLCGINTAKPIAFVEADFLGLRGKSYFVMEYIEGISLREYVEQYANDTESLEKMAKKVAFLLKNLAELHLTHGDLKATNILIANDKPYIIDLDGMIEHKTYLSLRRAWDKEIIRFMKNWDHSPSVQAMFESILK